jgi:hypothetical protein
MGNMKVVRNGVEVEYIEEEMVKVRETLIYPGWRHPLTISTSMVEGENSQLTIAMYIISAYSFLNASDLNLNRLRFSDRKSIVDALMQK